MGDLVSRCYMSAQRSPMIDPAIIDLMHHMSMPPPAIERPAGVRSWAVADTDAGEEHARLIEIETAKWIAEAEKRIAGLIADFAGIEATSSHLRRLDQMIDTVENFVASEALDYRRWVKRTQIIVKRVKARSAREGALVALQRDRILKALARHGLAKQDALSALRALRSEKTGASRSGPIFDNADDLTVYLRAAVA
jgi:hypothetical protein